MAEILGTIVGADNVGGSGNVITVSHNLLEAQNRMLLYSIVSTKGDTNANPTAHWYDSDTLTNPTWFVTDSFTIPADGSTNAYTHHVGYILDSDLPSLGGATDKAFTARFVTNRIGNLHIAVWAVSGVKQQAPTVVGRDTNSANLFADTAFGAGDNILLGCTDIPTQGIVFVTHAMGTVSSNWEYVIDSDYTEAIDGDHGFVGYRESPPSTDEIQIAFTGRRGAGFIASAFAVEPITVEDGELPINTIFLSANF